MCNQSKKIEMICFPPNKVNNDKNGQRKLSVIFKLYNNTQEEFNRVNLANITYPENEWDNKLPANKLLPNTKTTMVYSGKRIGILYYKSERLGSFYIRWDWPYGANFTYSVEVMSPYLTKTNASKLNEDKNLTVIVDIDSKK